MTSFVRILLPQCHPAGIHIQHLDPPMDASAELRQLDRHQIPTRISEGDGFSFSSNEKVQFRWCPLRVGADTTTPEGRKLSHRPDGIGLSLHRLPGEPSPRPRQHRYDGGRLPSHLGSETPQRDQGWRPTRIPGFRWIATIAWLLVSSTSVQPRLPVASSLHELAEPTNSRTGPRLLGAEGNDQFQLLASQPMLQRGRNADFAIRFIA